MEWPVCEVMSHGSVLDLFLQDDADTTVNDDDEPSENMPEDWNEEDQGLKNAATIGTSLMVVNSHRALFIL
jgi:hypothetical protein